MNQISPLAAGQMQPTFHLVDTELLLVRDYIYGVDGAVTLAADPIGDMDAVTKRYVDLGLGQVAPKTEIGPQPPANPYPGLFWWDTTGGQLFIWFNDGTSSQWVIANNTGIQNPPAGGITYGRRNNEWVPTTKTTISPYPPAQAAPTDFWWDSLDGQLYIRYDDGTSVQWVVANNLVGLRNFVPISGGTMTGYLTLNVDPLLPLHAATKQYVDRYRYLSYLDDAPPHDPYPGMLWFDTRANQLFVWRDNGISAQWVQANTPNFVCEPTPPAGGASVTVAATPPTGPRIGALWWDTVSGNLFIWYDDGTSAQWVIVVNWSESGVLPPVLPEEDWDSGLDWDTSGLVWP